MAARAATLLHANAYPSASGSKKASSSSASSSSFTSALVDLRRPTLISQYFCSRKLSRRRSACPLIVAHSVLPTEKPDRVSDRKEPKFSWRWIKAFAMGELQARKLRSPNTGTEALLMGILIEGTSQTSVFLWQNGITLFKVRDQALKLIGKPNRYFFSPMRPPLTESAQRAVDWAINEKLKSGENGEVNTTHMLLGIWSEEDSPGHKILTSLGFNNDMANELAKHANTDEVALSFG
ncbi:hypothetical protein HPP92_014519 [Vanilla planifolia]|uniref:Clp R domain-containing protein n=1 Tax=Vanilla planifolia TaxID=51239 RepID=A0A835UUM2_VANPL|nr:hypothetical protein HPP92_014952 [Vanilla planifolia]KAG0474833.1 hypothetical protein HPP92_014519 [Vanilla planifolia]